MQFYRESAPDLRITNLVDDGILGLLAEKNVAAALDRLRDMLSSAQRGYQARAILIACSSVPRRMVAALREGSEIPIVKIDEPMARRAIEAGSRIGVMATLPSTVEPTSSLILETAEDTGKPVELVTRLEAAAFQALNTGDAERHDSLLVAALEALQEENVDAIVLAQVSMARVLPKLDGRLRVPVLSSPSTSLEGLRAALALK